MSSRKICFWSCLLEIAFNNLAYSPVIQSLQNVLLLVSVVLMQMSCCPSTNERVALLYNATFCVQCLLQAPSPDNNPFIANGGPLTSQPTFKCRSFSMVIRQRTFSKSLTRVYSPWHQQQNGYPNNKGVKNNTCVQQCVYSHTHVALARL